MRCAIVGSRSFSDYAEMAKVLDETQTSGETVITEIVSGGAKGADALAERYAAERGIPVTVIRPDWEKFGRAAGVLRNRDIVTAADCVVAFWDGSSRGTKSTIDLAKKGDKLWILKNF